MSEEAIRSVCGPKLLVRVEGKSRDYRDVIVFEKLRFQIVFLPHKNAKSSFSNSSGLKSVFEKHRFRDEFV